MSFIDGLKNQGSKLKAQAKGFVDVCKYMYRDKVDRYMHIIILALFVGALIAGEDMMMGTAGFVGFYAFHATFRAAIWKRRFENSFK